MNTPSLTPAYLIAAVTAIVSLFLTQGLIDNGVEKLVTGLASILIPAAFAIAHALFHGRVAAAKINASVTALRFPVTGTSDVVSFQAGGSTSPGPQSPA